MSTTDFVLSRAESDLLPSAADVQSYAEHGWYLSKKLLTDDEVDDLVAASDRFYAGHRDRTLPAHPANLAYWTPADGHAMRHNDYIHYESDVIARILRKPIIGATAARLAQADEIRVFQSTMILKAPVATEPTNVVPWHFDKHYWQTCTSDRMLTAFIPFTDCTEEMGTITMVDGSHRWREIGGGDSTTRHFANRDNGELEALLEDNAAHNQATVRKIPVTIPKGHISFHHCRTYHGSGPNRSDQPRRAISLHLQDGANQYRPYRRSDGTVVEYNHDNLVRTAPQGGPDYADPEYCPVLWS
ncbi:phytanoyl-CoA dioxygenase family protein [Actinokineospora sp.]|uniref:phytanoyl-CoA dioxygenase family protein n=1 Tax=Actinokineospora sp. TaxID=1872133 RepID=UPI0040378673